MKDFAKSIVCNTKAGDKKTENNIPDAQINGPSAAEIREVAGRIYKTDMREDDLARAVSCELAKKYKAFQTNTHIMDMVKEVLKKFKTGNSKTGNESLGEYMSKKPRVINEEKTGAEEFFKKLAKDGEERAEKDDEDIEKVGNREIYVNQSEQTKAVVYEDGTIMLWDKNGNNYKTIKAGSLEEARKKLNSDYKKVGNAKDKNDRDMKIGDMVDVHGKKGKIQKIITAKDSRDDVIQVFFDNSGTYNPDRTDRFYANEVVKIGNKKLKFTDKKDGLKEFVYDEENDKGYIYYDGKLVDTIPHAGQGWLNLIKQKAFSSGVMNKTGNSASDDKFAYVMREFDEGKLKTTDGKVVTDPAQAKAIAYSESKKAENGLARARNAIKK